MQVFDDVAETISEAFNLDDAKTRLIRTGLIVVTVVIAARYVSGLLRAN